VRKAKKKRAGRPNHYDTLVEPRLEEIGWWAREGLCDEEIWTRLGISKRSLYKYKAQYSQFKHALKTNKAVANYRMVDSLYKLGMGFTVTDVTQEYEYTEVENAPRKKKLVSSKRTRKHILPSVAAIVVYLKNCAGWHNSDRGTIDNDTGKLDDLISAIKNTKRD